ncbi:hypothetical protein AVEN_5543-1 [Araneus ventricosus]|uniref:Uncharacterized protein n=1 Tax=Araneus ventricosus TaxID=182803 RepID=A0A4Y2DXT7_ARAVE|nr:hypothetical protein AVEN_5543-1 [Araneus ventricosus]
MGAFFFSFCECEATHAVKQTNFFPICNSFSLVILMSRFEAKLVGMDFVILHHGQMTRTVPELARPLQTTPAGGRSTPTYDLTCSKPNAPRMFSELGFRTWNNSGFAASTLPLGHCYRDSIQRSNHETFHSMVQD